MSLSKKPKDSQVNKSETKATVVSKPKSNTSKPKVKPKSVSESLKDDLLTKELIEQSLLRHKRDHLIDRKRNFKEVSHLALIAEEYLSSFALIGYSLQNEKVVVINMPTPKDEAALVDLLRATFVDLASNRP
jgi:hypothetical protein